MSNCFDNQIIDVIGLCDIDNFNINEKDPNWIEISIPEVLMLPEEKPNIETIEKVFVKVKIISKRIINTPNSNNNENVEGTKLTGKKLVVEGILKQKIVYTANVRKQTVHSAHFNVPFSAFIVLKDTTPLDANLCVRTCIEDVYVKAFNDRQIFKNVTILLNAVPIVTCP